MEEQGAGIYDYEFCTVYTSINTALWVTIFAITIIILSRNLNFKRKYCFNVLWALVVLCLLRFFLNFEIPFFTYNLRSYTILVKIREIFRYNFYTYCYEDDIGKIYYYFTLGRLMEVIYLATTIVLLIKKSLRCRQLYRIVNLMNCTDNIEILNALKIAKQKVGVRKNVGIIVNKNIRTPVIIGYFKPVIILPVVELSEIQLITVLSHELIHYKYKHIFIKLLVEIICVVMWWNPVFYFFRKEVFNILEFYTDRKLNILLNNKEKKEYLLGIVNVIENYGGRNNTLDFSLGLDEENNERVMTERFKLILDNAYINKNRIKDIVIMTVFFVVYIFSYYRIPHPAGEPTFDDYNEDAPVIVEGSYIIKDENRSYTIYSPDREKLITVRGKLKENIKGVIVKE